MEFIAIILDVRSHMYDGTDEINSIIQGINSVNGLIKKKLFAESKDELSVILCGSHDTSNSLNTVDPANYKHITVIRGLERADWELMKMLNKNDKRFGSDNGDLLEAILVAADHLVNELKYRKLIGTKKIVLISNLEGNTYFSQMDSILTGLAKEEIELNVISGRGFHGDEKEKMDDADGPSTVDGSGIPRSSEKLSENRVRNERELSKMISELNGVTYSFEEALLSLEFIETKSVKQWGWKANLEISDICQISVAGYSKVKAAHPQTLKLRYGGDLAAEVERRVTYHLGDDKNTVVNVEDTIKGFKYGNSLVPFTEDDISGMELSVVKSLKLIGFCKDDNMSRDIYVGDTSLIFVADHPASKVAFTALVHAMYECNVVALVRRVYNRGSAPRLAVLSPKIKNDSVSLVYLELAFGEDIRTCSFPSLPSSISGNRTRSQVISDGQLQAVDRFIDHLMLIKKNDDNKEETEVYKPSSVASPSVQMFYHCASHKFLNPTEVLPELNDRIMSKLSPPPENQSGLQQLIDGIKELFPLKNRDNLLKKKKPMTNEENQQNGDAKRSKTEINDHHPESFGDVISADVSGVGLASPVEDLNRLLLSGEVVPAMEGMQTVIWRLINESYLDTLYPKAILCLKELRQRVLEYSGPNRDLISPFNDFLGNMKRTLSLSPSKSTFWSLLKTDDINLIGDSESILGCTDQDRRLFFDDKEESVMDEAATLKEEDMDTLFDDM